VRFAHERAQVFVMPIKSMHSYIGSAKALLSLLPGSEPYPRYLDDLPLGDEADLRAELVSLTDRLDVVRSSIEARESAKGILYMTDFGLQAEVVGFLNEELGVPARLEEGNREDFWLLDPSDASRQAIGEVKGPGKKNLNKGDVGALMGHRQEAGLDDDFPALLVGNTFHRRGTIDERDVEVPEPVHRLAAQEHVLIVRTLDLFRLRQMQLTRMSTPALLGETVRAGGWLEVTAAGQWNHHG
jgi:hypothetical protein